MSLWILGKQFKDFIRVLYIAVETICEKNYEKRKDKRANCFNGYTGIKSEDTKKSDKI